jgi:hypothetical protein
MRKFWRWFLMNGESYLQKTKISVNLSIGLRSLPMESFQFGLVRKIEV